MLLQFVPIFAILVIFKPVALEVDVKVNIVRDTVITNENQVELKNGRTSESCGSVSDITKDLDATEGALKLLKYYIRNAQVNAHQLKMFSCDESSNIKEAMVKRETNNTPQGPKNCDEIKLNNASSTSGVYLVSPRYLNRSIEVYCDMDTENGGWTVIQRRDDFPGERENFLRNWEDYKKGFGDINKEFWLGNDAIFALTNDEHVTLRMELEDFDGVKKYADYKTFIVGTEINKYQLKIGGYSGDAKDAMSFVNGGFFNTIDKQVAMSHELPGKTCVEAFKAGWWYVTGGCHQANPNGIYHMGNHTTYADGVNWKYFKGYYYSLKRVEMKIKTLNNSINKVTV